MCQDSIPVLGGYADLAEEKLTATQFYQDQTTLMGYKSNVKEQEDWGSIATMTVADDIRAT